MISLAPSPYGGASLGRCPDGFDSDQAGIDFVSFPVPTPGARNDMSEPCGYVDTGVVDSGVHDTGGADTGDTGRDDSGESAGEDSAASSGADTADTGESVSYQRSCGCQPGSGAAPVGAGVVAAVLLARRRQR